MAKKQVKSDAFIATGRRKKSIARVRLLPGTGVITVNGRHIDEYLQRDTLILIAKQPLVLTNTADKFDVFVNVVGGGIAGQAGAICHGIARALVKEDETYKAELEQLLRETKAQIKKVKGDIAKTYRKAGLDYIYK